MEGENAYGRRDLGNTSKYRVFFADCFLVPKQQLYLVRTESTGYTTVVLIGKNMVAIIILEGVQLALIVWNPIHEQFTVAHIKGKLCNLLGISFYVPMFSTDDLDKERFYIGHNIQIAFSHKMT